MADISDVEDALCSQILKIIYPLGVDSGSVCGGVVKIFRGWPTSKALNADLLVGTQTITVFSRKNATRDTSRYPRVWRTITAPAPSLLAAATGNTVSLGGSPATGQIVGVVVDGVAYTYALLSSDTLASVAEALASLIPGAIASNASIKVAGAYSLTARVAGVGVAEMETRRQEQAFAVSIWCPTPATRDVLSVVIDRALSNVDWLPLSGGTVGRITYIDTEEVDTSETANLYRRNLGYKVEYPTTIQMAAPAMLFGCGSLSTDRTMTRFGVSPPRHGSPGPVLGAIRFDAWYDPENPIDSQCAAVLSVPDYRYRLPYNATLLNGSASWSRASQATIDFEISAAVVAGLTFWAFDSYSPGDTLSLALQLYLTSSLRSKIRFCMLGQVSNWGEGGRDQPSLLRDISMMTQPGYMTVLDDRPLYLVLDASDAQLSGLPAGGVPAAIAFVRSQVQAAGGANPYVVWLSGAALADYSNIAAAEAAGADAAGAYCTPRLNGTVQPASALFQAAEADWSARAAAGYPMIPTAMTGWDQRPLIQTPQPFYPLPIGSAMSNYYQSPSNLALTGHIAALSRAIAMNRDACPAQIGLIYAWNELAEGGWLVPTYTESGPDMDRVAAAAAAVGIAQDTETSIQIDLRV